jgi:EAL domain-containing protein (putative c-di-GMP-specific phosphodiesterase class I)/CheY-like chemotaxis protein
MPVCDLRFLVAEDHDFQRRAQIRLLEGIGAAAVYEASDGHSALAILQDPSRAVDIVISDLEMPGMDGMEFIRHVGQAGVRISMILASALEPKLLASIATMSEAYGINLLGVVEKPLTTAKLAPLLERHNAAQAVPKRPQGPAFTLGEIAAGLKNGEFEPFFQPKIDLLTGQICGVEALARWRHPEQGIIAPHAFIQLLEDNGMIDELMWVMLRKSAALCSTWRNAGLGATVSVNLSLKSLSDVLLAERVTNIVRSEALDPRHVVLEVTESATTTDVAKALENLARLRIKGFGLSIDDYGTGYSSMQQLTRIAFTELKIDQSFVINAVKQESARVILDYSLKMAKRLNITSVAEGVETSAAFRLLGKLHCNVAQGYFIARPMEYAAFPGWAREWQARAARS